MRNPILFTLFTLFARPSCVPTPSSTTDDVAVTRSAL